MAERRFVEIRIDRKYCDCKGIDEALRIISKHLDLLGYYKGDGCITCMHDIESFGVIARYLLGRRDILFKVFVRYVPEWKKIKRLRLKEVLWP